VDLWEYIPVTDKWFKKASFPGSARYDAVAFTADGKGYLFSGELFLRPFNDLWQYTPVSNEPPIAAGFTMMYYYPDGHLLNAWGSYDPEGGPVKFLWKKVGGPAQYKMLYENASTPVISELVTGTYTFQLTVTDQEGATATTEVDLTVKVNQPPVANGFVMMYYYPDAHLLNAWGSYDPDGEQVKFWWSKIGGPAQYNMLYPEASTPVISDLIDGTYSFQLRVTDNEGATAYDTVEIVNSIPLASNRSGRMVNEITLSPLANETLIISPNPVTDVLNLRWSSAYAGAAKLTVMDMSGKAVKVVDLRKEQQELRNLLQVDALKAGSYYLFIRTANGKTASVRFIKQ
jgi:hypothetical protein